MRDLYDDKIERRINERMLQAKMRKKEQQKACIIQLVGIIAVLAIIVLIAVLSVKGCSNADKNKENTKQSEDVSDDIGEETSEDILDDEETSEASGEETSEDDVSNLVGKTVYTTESLYMRQDANSKSTIIIQMPINAELKVLSISIDKKWAKVRYVDETGEKLKGYAAVEYLSLEKSD